MWAVWEERVRTLLCYQRGWTEAMSAVFGEEGVGGWTWMGGSASDFCLLERVCFSVVMGCRGYISCRTAFWTGCGNGVSKDMISISFAERRSATAGMKMVNIKASLHLDRLIMPVWFSLNTLAMLTSAGEYINVFDSLSTEYSSELNKP